MGEISEEGVAGVIECSLIKDKGGHGPCRGSDALEARLPRPRASFSKVNDRKSSDDPIHWTLDDTASSRRLYTHITLPWTT